MAFRTASRFLNPVQALIRALVGIMGGRFDTRLPAERRDEFGDLAVAFNAMAAGVEEGRRLRSFVSDSVRSAASDESKSRAAMAGENRSAAILFAAPAGFAAFSRGHSPETLVVRLNRYLALMAGAIRRNGGEIDKFIGEKILAVFDAGKHGSLDEATHAAAQAVTDMRRAMHDLVHELPLPLGIGIASGPVLAGIMGTAEVRLEYTVIGDTVNTAARLCDLATKGGGGTVIEGTAAAALHNRDLTPVGEIFVKGKAHHVSAFRLLTPVE
ncbi:HAMP domain-containing protein [Candidatus Ozemobacteraceae bacterium]|nr:HAMP domain-containing protein [Candidatus Ozemobacteraceae bacterium]